MSEKPASFVPKGCILEQVVEKIEDSLTQVELENGH